ncbi:MAG TPA: hypothetical protein VFF80_02015 [Bacillota bacterium]|nr:hypothetical protein [Bacillota bacterium]
MKRRSFTAEYKTKIILEALRGEKELNVIATENELALKPDTQLESRISKKRNGCI